MTTLETTDDLLRAARENAEFREAFRDELLREHTDERIDALAENVATLTENVASLTANLAALTEQVNAFVQATNDRFDRLDRRFSRVNNDLTVLKWMGLENRLYYRGVVLMATHLRMREGRIVRVAEADDNSREFNGVILAALNGGGITQAQYDRILDTDMVVAGTEIESGSPIYAVIEASYSLSGDDISKVCATTTLVRRLFPETVVKPVLYYMTPNARLEGEAADQGVTLVSTPAIR